MILAPASRNPIRLPASTIETVLTRPLAPAERLWVDGGPFRASLVFVTFNNYLFTRMCLESVLFNTTGLNYEVVIVDNASTDDTREYLKLLEQSHANLRIILNETNRGFAPAVNQGLSAAKGECLVILNNDTIVTPGWLPRLLAHLEDASIGMAGPVTNRTGNEAQIEVTYETYGDLVAFSRKHAAAHADERFDIPVLTMFCAAMRREVYDTVGPLDERFEIGFFEDDDYSMRVRAGGYRIVCAEDTFIHHFSGASFGMLAALGKYGDLFHANRRRWEEKWQRQWTPHKHRQNAAYDTLVDRIRTIAKETLPKGRTVAVVSKGDIELLNLEGRTAWHFPQSDDGEYTGYYPADSSQAIAQLEALRSKGAEFLVFPDPSLWWLDHYEGFGNYLHASFPVITKRPKACVIFDLRAK
jgi:GT2 family glycosyltransferase